MREIATVAVGYGRENVFAVARGFEHDLCDARKIFTYRIGIVGIVRAQLVKVNLLIKVQVGFGSLALPRETRVINAGPVRVPGCAAAGGGILDVRNRVREPFGRGGFANVQRGGVASAFGQLDGDLLAIM